jgi:hypothetical protein
MAARPAQRFLRRNPHAEEEIRTPLGGERSDDHGVGSSLAFGWREKSMKIIEELRAA